MAEATPVEGEEKTPNPDTATPSTGAEQGSNASVAPDKDAPAVEKGDDKKPETLEEAQAEVERLTGESAKANARQAESDKRSKKLERENKRLKMGSSKPSSPEPDDGDGGNGDGESATSQAAETAEEMRTAEGKVSRLLIDPKYRPLLDSDPTLLTVLQRNPLAFVDDFIDADDALDQTTEMLDERLSKLPAPKEEKAEEKEEEGAKQFNAGPANPQTGPSGPKSAEQHRKEGNNDMAVETSILDKINTPRK